MELLLIDAASSTGFSYSTMRKLTTVGNCFGKMKSVRRGCHFFVTDGTLHHFPYVDSHKNVYHLDDALSKVMCPDCTNYLSGVSGSPCKEAEYDPL